MTTVIQRFIESEKEKFLAVASSAVAALLLVDGRTAHSASKIPVLANLESTFNIDADTQLARELCKTRFIIPDKIRVTHRHNLGAVDRTLCFLRHPTLPFGRPAMLRIGNFRLVHSVVRAVHRF